MTRMTRMARTVARTVARWLADLADPLPQALQFLQ